MPAKRKAKRSKVPAGGRKRKLFTRTVRASPASRGELKFIDTLYNGIRFSTTTGLRLLNGTIAGSSANNRIGRSINMMSIEIKGKVVLSALASAAVVMDTLRILLVYDKQTNAAAPSITDVLQSIDVTVTATNDATSMPNMTNANRFVILRDWRISTASQVTNPSAGAAQSIFQLMPGQLKGHASGLPLIEARVNLRGKKVQYNTGAAGTIADIATGSLYIVTSGLQPIGSSQFDFFFDTRLRFYDR